MSEQTPPAAPAAKAPKKKKAKGPIRFEAIVPFLIIVGVIWAYFFFFFDTHVRHGLEYFGTNANGAEVNIGSLHTSFWSASLEINKIQVTDKEAPIKNKIQIGKIRWKMLWDALLRGKVAIDEASILEIAVGAPREKPGRVLPPDPPSSESAFDKIRKQALDKAQQEFSKNVLGDVASLLNGTNPADQLKSIEGQLKSSARVKELQVELKKKEEEWKQRIDRLPQKKDFDAIQAKVKGIKTDRFNNPAEIQTSLQQLNDVFKEVDSKVKEVQATGGALNSDLGTYKNTISDLDAMIRQDIKDLENRLKLPKLDVASISQSLFGPMFLNKVKQAEFYMAKAREYMPPKKTSTEKAEFEPPKPHEREKGRNYKFGRTKAYPLFWLHHAELSSKYAAGADWSGNLSGSLTDVTDDPPTLGRPTLAQFKGDFPKQELMGVDGKVTIDHVTDIAMERLDLKVGSFPVQGQKLVQSDDVTLGFENAAAATQFKAELKGGEISIVSQSSFQKGNGPPPVAAPGSAAPIVSNSLLMAEAKQPILAQILKGAFADIPKVTLNASVEGPWSALRFSLNSNLGAELQKAFDKQIQMKINEARAKLQSLIDEQVGKEREKLNAEFNKIKGQVDDLLKGKQAELDKFKGQIDNAKNEAMNGQKKKLEDEGKKALDQLKNKFKF
jgi:uncharacterized protein (TIGR03545 family)